MDLQVFISKKGTKVVLATDLHRALQLSDHHYPTNVRRWIQDIYQFQDGIRQPGSHSDFAKRKVKTGDGITTDYYLSVELAKLITLNSRSKVKQKYANFLLKQEAAQGSTAALTPDEVLSTIELIKAMSFVSCQLAAENCHRAAYEQRNGGPDYWPFYRAEMIGYRKDEIREQLAEQEINAPAKASLRELLFLSDPYELIRVAVIDHCLGTGKNVSFARQLGAIAKTLASELKLDIIDDQQGANLFAPTVDPDLVRRIKGADRTAAA